jgi:hypothetical protein
MRFVHAELSYTRLASPVLCRNIVTGYANESLTLMVCIAPRTCFAKLCWSDTISVAFNIWLLLRGNQRSFVMEDPLSFNVSVSILYSVYYSMSKMPLHQFLVRSRL